MLTRRSSKPPMASKASRWHQNRPPERPCTRTSGAMIRPVTAMPSDQRSGQMDAPPPTQRGSLTLRRMAATVWGCSQLSASRVAMAGAAGAHRGVAHGGDAFGVLHHAAGAQGFGNGLGGVGAAVQGDDHLHGLPGVLCRAPDALEAAPNETGLVVGRDADRQCRGHGAFLCHGSGVHGGMKGCRGIKGVPPGARPGRWPSWRPVRPPRTPRR